MPIEPNGGVWGALLGSCRAYSNPNIAQIAANHLFELEPNAIGNYILLSNIYASVGAVELCFNGKEADERERSEKKSRMLLVGRLSFRSYLPET
ncbi:hypothetical protein V6N13_053231 [Hibiscus sabdariffa]|uniref:Pentatricopeptide repeat-containing protein n=1 Tax=Hibiscus sabdariffa TaxID=183260 RepID=A0ABR1ZV31_9ROSI